MGKKSKRQRSSQAKASTGGGRPAPALRRPEEEETKDNLRFQDPFVDEFEEYDPNEEDVPPEEGEDERQSDVRVASWNPLTGSPLGKGEALEMDASAYKMHHAFTNEWPSLTFDFVRDDFGESRTRFPHSLMAVVGTQAPSADKNQITLIKLSDLARMNVETEDDILGDELDGGADSESDEDDDDVDLDPVLEHVSVPHYGGVNRIRTMPQRTDIVASWSDKGQVNVYDVSFWKERFSGHTRRMPAASDRHEKPVFTYKGHNGVEGYALDWSNVNVGSLATGDCNGNIHLWQPEAESMKEHACPIFQTTPSYESETSVEDLQWSPTESTVLAAASCVGYVQIYDTRAPHRAMLTHQIHKKSKADVNVLSWNHLVSNLLATGGDDGMLSVWDLRNSFQEPLARFTSHKSPITSVEWHPSDESMLAVSDDVGAYVYDLSVEEDDNVGGKRVDEDIPPQLLFAHCGSEQFKELHWHPQIQSCLMTTALTGFSVFIPSNL